MWRCNMFYDVEFEKDITNLSFKPTNSRLKQPKVKFHPKNKKSIKLFMPKKTNFNWMKKILGDGKEQVYY